MLNYNEIFVNRIGVKPSAYMRTNKLVCVLAPNCTFKFDGTHLICLKPNETDLPEKKLPHKIPPINSVNVSGKFVKNQLTEQTKNNILGKNDLFITKKIYLTIPETFTSEQTLKIFNCKLIKPGNTVKFECDNELPLFEVSVGPDYVQEYLLQPGYGNGFYIETHNTPHYHQPMDSTASGFLILGLKTEQGMLLTKFKIPFGYGVYMGPNTLHSDAFLVGNYHVVYTKTPDYSTYLFVNPDNSIVQVD